MTSKDRKPGNTVEIFVQKYNLLKNKAGVRTNIKDPGFIEDKKIEAADELITQLCEKSKEKLEEQIGMLVVLWKDIQEMPDNAARKEKTQKIFTIAHEIKDISALCNYNLIAHFAESLRDYIDETTINLKNQRIIIQAHIDALNTTFKTGVSDENDPVAEELKSKVKIAIQKYH
ncbi:MAG: hypothetical protein KAJ29_02235 [Alphaproteobacteria bacterium]|nr:hypothetical protein [Alphaproteobacteria bacterium]